MGCWRATNTCRYAGDGPSHLLACAVARGVRATRERFLRCCRPMAVGSTQRSGGQFTPGSELAAAILDGLEVAAVAVDVVSGIRYQSALARQLSSALAAELAAQAVVAHVANARRPFVIEGDGIRWRGWAWALSPAIAVGVAQRMAPARSICDAVAATLGIRFVEARLALSVARGLSNQHIAASLGVPVGTLNTRLWRLYRRLGVQNRADLAARVSHVVASHSGVAWDLEPAPREGGM